MLQFTKNSIGFLVFILVLFSCANDKVKNNFITENVIVIVVDGARYSETWGDPTHQYVPNMADSMASFGVINTNFYSKGDTWTVTGHTAITTGNFQTINNTGLEIPKNASFFQCYLKEKGFSSTSAWIVASKDKLEVLSDCTDSKWKCKYTPSKNCGVNGIGTGYRNDSLTFIEIMNVFDNFQPNLMLINFREPDFSGHQGNWPNYLKGITHTDEYVYQIWKYIQTNPFYKDKTTLFVTNDHGRHLDSVADGFVSHGDNCEGCKHLNLYAFGPDFKKGIEVNQRRNLTDISATIAYLLNFNMPKSKGNVMLELIK